MTQTVAFIEMIMVSPAATPRRREAAVLAVVVTVAKGYDLGYIWKPRTTPPDAPPAATTSTPPRPGNRPAAGGDLVLRPSASPRDKPSNVSPTTRYTSRPTRAPAPGSAVPAAGTRHSLTTWPG